VNPLIERIYQTGCIEDAEGKAIPGLSISVPREVGATFYEWIRRENLCRTIEIGMAYGLSTLFICQAHADRGSGSHIAIDPLQSSMFKSIGVLNLKKAGLAPYLRFIEAPSDEALPQLHIEGAAFDFAFIDGWHTFDYALVDFFYLDKMLTVGGYLAFDDVAMPSVRRVVAYVLTNRSYQLVPAGIGLPAWKHLLHETKRFLQGPCEEIHTWRLGLHRICLLKKVAVDHREWDFHRAF
jgi:predicted O-methyltransferase YrrM